MTGMNRRSFLGGAAGLTTSALAIPAFAKSSGAAQRPGRIIHMVADGMSLGTLTCADYLSQQLRQRGLTWVELFRQPSTRRALMNMRSLNSMVTDSAAASSSWGSGSRVKNGAINLLPNGTRLKTLYELFGDIGWKRGLVTTTEITHATPAGFAACVDHRESAEHIALQYLDRQIEVLLGGGQKFFDPGHRKDKRNLKEEFTISGYQVMKVASQLEQASTAWPWLGVFSDSHLPFSLDQKSNPELQKNVPQLSVMTRRALEWLGRHEHFILQVEGGRVDHAAHNCDAAAALHDMLAFDEAIDEVLAFQKLRPDTLVVITTDHGNGNMGVNGSGSEYGHSSQMFQKLAQVKLSFGEILRQLHKKPKIEQPVDDSAPPAATEVDAGAQNLSGGERKPKTKEKPYVPSVKEIQQIIDSATGYKVSDRRAGWFQAFLAKKGTSLYELMNSEVVQLGQLMANHLGVGWTGNVHTSDYVPLTAIGPGAERFEGFIDNVDIFRHYTELAKIDYRNPAGTLLASGPDASEVERLSDYVVV